MFSFLKNNWSKWKVITTYNYDYQIFILLAKKKKITGDLKFKNIHISNKGMNCFNNVLDSQKQFLDLLDDK